MATPDPIREEETIHSAPSPKPERLLRAASGNGFEFGHEDRVMEAEERAREVEHLSATGDSSVDADGEIEEAVGVCAAGEIEEAVAVDAAGEIEEAVATDAAGELQEAEAEEVEAEEAEGEEVEGEAVEDAGQVDEAESAGEMDEIVETVEAVEVAGEVEGAAFEAEEAEAEGPVSALRDLGVTKEVSPRVRSSAQEEAFKCAQQSYSALFWLEMGSKFYDKLRERIWFGVVLGSFGWLVVIGLAFPDEQDYGTHGFPNSDTVVYIYMYVSMWAFFVTVAQLVGYLVYAFVIHRAELSSPQQWWQLTIIVLSIAVWGNRAFYTVLTGFDPSEFVIRYDVLNKQNRYMDSVGIFLFSWYLLVQHRSGYFPIHFLRNNEEEVCGVKLNRTRQFYPWSFYAPAALYALVYSIGWCGIALQCEISPTPGFFGGIIYAASHDVDMGSSCSWLMILLDLFQGEGQG